MENETKGFWYRTGVALGLRRPVQEQASDVREELPILTTPNMPINVRNLSGLDNTAVSADRALGLAGVYRAVSIVSTDVCQLPIGVWRDGAELTLPTTSLTNKPNMDMPMHAFLEETAISLAVSGNAYWRLTRQSATASVNNIEVLNPHNVRIERTESGKKKYRYGDQTFADWQVKHLQLLRLPGYEYGTGPIQAAQNELRGALNLRNYADNWFVEGGIPSGVLKTEQSINSDIADEYRTRWNDLQANGRGVAVLGSGLNYTPIYLSPADAQFLESQAFTVTQIARMFGIPAIHMMTDPGNSMTYVNAEQVEAAYLKHTLMKYLIEIEAAFTDLLPRGQVARFKVDGLLRADLATRTSAYATALASGWLTVDEVRAQEGLLPLAGTAAPVGNQNTGETE